MLHCSARLATDTYAVASSVSGRRTRRRRADGSEQLPSIALAIDHSRTSAIAFLVSSFVIPTLSTTMLIYYLFHLLCASLSILLYVYYSIIESIIHLTVFACCSCFHKSVQNHSHRKYQSGIEYLNKEAVIRNSNWMKPHNFSTKYV